MVEYTAKIEYSVKLFKSGRLKQRSTVTKLAENQHLIPILS
jgi:hypothetical protein